LGPNILLNDLFQTLLVYVPPLISEIKFHTYTLPISLSVIKFWKPLSLQKITKIKPSLHISPFSYFQLALPYTSPFASQFHKLHCSLLPCSRLPSASVTVPAPLGEVSAAGPAAPLLFCGAAVV
jgi:hypothetical protein